jgi:cytosine deaminase
MNLDLVISNARTTGHHGLVDIGILGGLVIEISPRIEAGCPRFDAQGSLAFGGFVDTHIHLDKALILDRCRLCAGTLDEAVELSAKAKTEFTEEDVYLRAARVIEMAILQGTTRMRTFVEIDPRAGFRSFEAIKRVRRDFAFAIDIEICAFAQEGLTNEPETARMIEQALQQGAGMIGGCPYTDPDPVAHVKSVFDMAERFGVRVDFHADFDLDPSNSILPEIISETVQRKYQGRVSVGHVTKLSAMPENDVKSMARQMADAGIAVTILPATDMYLTGRHADRLVPRGIAPGAMLSASGVGVSLATNNILNPFTPYGDASLVRMANHFANVAHLATEQELSSVFDMVTVGAARQLGAPYGIAAGLPADIVIVDAPDPASAIRMVAPALAGWKHGRQSFRRAKAELLRPDSSQTASAA